MKYFKRKFQCERVNGSLKVGDFFYAEKLPRASNSNRLDDPFLGHERYNKLVVENMIFKTKKTSNIQR